MKRKRREVAHLLDLDAPILREEQMGLIWGALRTIDARTAYVIKRRFGLFDHPVQTREEIGRQLGVKRERVRQIEAKGMRLLRLRSGILRYGLF
jgi:DNA-directed RNA polymerase sigma subunit (sigma70/sigma32)